MIRWQDSNLEPTAWASNSGEEKDSLDHSATGHYVYNTKGLTKYCASKRLRVS